MTFGERIRQLRVIKLGWSQEALSMTLKCKTRRSVENWENDRALPTLENFFKLLKCFDVSFDEFMKGVDIEWLIES